MNYSLYEPWRRALIMDNNVLKNHELNLAEDYVQYTGKHIFLTGKAGTGKNTSSKKSA
jgi:hypothetical protein